MTESTIVPLQHHHLGPSSIGDSVPGRCQGKHRREAGLPELGDSSAGFGTDCHDELARILNSYLDNRNPENLKTDHIKDHEMRFFVGRCIQYLKNRKLLDDDFAIEMRVAILDNHGKLVTYGTLDFAAWKRGMTTLTVVDWKSHKAELDQINATHQIASYICGACQELDKESGTGYLYLPFMDLDYEFKGTEKEIRGEITDIVRSAELPNSPIVPGSWCKYCKAKFVCPEFKEVAKKATDVLVVPEKVKSKKALQKDFEDQIRKFVADGNADRVAEFGEMLSTLEPALSAWRSVVKDLMEHGYEKNFPKWEIKEKRGNRHAPVMEVFNVVQSTIPADQFAQCASVKWKDLEQHWVENIQAEAFLRDHEITKVAAVKMLDDLLEPIVERTSRKELWRKK